MTHILHIQASPNRRQSHSEAAAQTLLDGMRAAMPDATLDTIDVWDLAMPEFDDTMIEAKFAVLRAREATDEQRRRWGEAVAIAQRFNRADLYVLSVPMWNFGVPYRLKHFIDVVTLPGENWTWSRERGYSPLLRDKRAILVLSSANRHDDDLPPGFARDDFQRLYLRRWLAFVGIDVIKEIRVSPTLTNPDHLAAVKADAHADAVRFAATLQEETLHVRDVA